MIYLLQGWEDCPPGSVKARTLHCNISIEGGCVPRRCFIAAHGKSVLKLAADSPFGYFPSVTPRDMVRKNIMTDRGIAR
jgi:hypothetical protein